MSRILIVDDHPVFRRGLAALLSTAHHEIIGEASTAEKAFVLARGAAPEIVVMDIGLPDVHGVVATARLMAEHPLMKIVVVTAFHDAATVRAALDAGAVGFIVKDAAPEQILAAVRSAAVGVIVLGEGIAPVPSRAGMRALAVSSGLTRREEVVMELMADDLNNAQIAERLSLTTKTVANYISNVLMKISARDRGEAIRRVRALD